MGLIESATGVFALISEHRQALLIAQLVKNLPAMQETLI